MLMVLAQSMVFFVHILLVLFTDFIDCSGILFFLTNYVGFSLIFTLDFRGLHVDISRLCCTVYFKISCLFYIYSTVHFNIFLW